MNFVSITSTRVERILAVLNTDDFVSNTEHRHTLNPSCYTPSHSTLMDSVFRFQTIKIEVHKDMIFGSYECRIFSEIMILIRISKIAFIQYNLIE